METKQKTNSSASPGKAQESQSEFKTTTNIAESTVPSSAQNTTLSVTLAPLKNEDGWWKENATFVTNFVTLVGVVLAMWAANHRMRIELQASVRRAAIERRHSRELAHVERITAARREVYLEAVEGINVAQRYLASLAGRDLKSVDLSEAFASLSAAVGKVNILGEMSTVIKVRKLVDVINTAMLKCYGDLLPLDKHNTMVQIYTEGYESAQLEVKRLLSAMKSYNESNQQDNKVFEALQNSFNTQNAIAKDMSARRYVEQQEVTRGQIGYLDILRIELKQISELIDELIFEIRQELGLQTSVDLLKETTRISQENSDAATKDLMEKLTKVFGPPSEGAVSLDSESKDE